MQESFTKNLKPTTVDARHIKTKLLDAEKINLNGKRISDIIKEESQPVTTFDHIPNLPSATGQIRSIEYGNGVWVAATEDGIYSSVDNGLSWSQTNLTTPCGRVFYWAAKGKWFAGGFSVSSPHVAPGLFTSNDGLTWKEIKSPASVANATPACFAASDSLIVAGLLAGKGVITSTDGVTWSVAATTTINTTPVTAAVYANGTWYFGVRGTASAGSGKGGVWSTTDPTTTDVTAVDNTNISTAYQVDRLHYIDGVVYASATNYPTGTTAPANPNGGIYKLDGTTWTKIVLNRPNGTVETGVYYAYDMVKLDVSIYASLWSGNGNVLKLNADGTAFDYESNDFLLDLGYDGQIYSLGCNGDTLIAGSYAGDGLFIAKIPTTYASQIGLRAVEESLNKKIDKSREWQPEDFKNLVKRCELPDDANYILWTDTGNIAYMSFADRLINGSYMFRSCRKLTSFNSDLSSLTNGHYMFNRCNNLKSFESDLSSLTDGSQMFEYCTSLTSFESDLSSLTDGNYMFYNCKLDTASVQNIASTINTVSSGKIYIGIQASLEGTTEINNAISTIQSKGWTVTTKYKA